MSARLKHHPDGKLRASGRISPFDGHPLRLERGLEPLGKRRKEFGEAEGPLRAERAGESESLGQGEVSKLQAFDLPLRLDRGEGWGEVSIPRLRHSHFALCTCPAGRGAGNSASYISHLQWLSTRNPQPR